MEIKLSQRLKELRTEQGLSQKQFAANMQLNTVTYLHYEKGHREPPLALLVEFAKYYGVSTDYLLGVTDY